LSERFGLGNFGRKKAEKEDGEENAEDF